MKDPATVLSPAEIRFERLLPGPIGTVWAFLTEVEKRGEWFASGSMEPRVGGKIQFRFKHSELSPNKAAPPERFTEMDRTGHRSEALVTEIEAPHHLAFTWRNSDGSESEVVFDLKEQGDEVLLTLTHRKLTSRSDMVGFAGGWQSHLAILTEKARGRVPRAFWDVWRSIDGEYEKLIPG